MANNSHAIPLRNEALVEVINKYGLQSIWAQTYLTEDQRYAKVENMLRTKHVQQSQYRDQLARLDRQLNNTIFANMNISLAKIQAMTDLKAINKRLSNRQAAAVKDEAVWCLIPSIQDLEKGLHSEKRLIINLGKSGKTITAFNTLLDTRYYAGFKPGTPIFRVECPPPAVVMPSTGSSAAGVPYDFFHLGLLPQESLSMIDYQPERRLKFVYEGRVPRSSAEMLARIGQLVPDVVVMIASIYLAAIPNLDTFLGDLLSGPRRGRDARSISASDLCMLHTMFVLFRESKIDFDKKVTKAFRYHPKVTELSALLATPRLTDLIKHLSPLIYIIERMTGHSMIRIARSKFDADAAMSRAEIGKTSNMQSIFFHADPLFDSHLFYSNPCFQSDPINALNRDQFENSAEADLHRISATVNPLLAQPQRPVNGLSTQPSSNASNSSKKRKFDSYQADSATCTQQRESTAPSGPDQRQSELDIENANLIALKFATLSTIFVDHKNKLELQELSPSVPNPSDENNFYPPQYYGNSFLAADLELFPKLGPVIEREKQQFVALHENTEEVLYQDIPAYYLL